MGRNWIRTKAEDHSLMVSVVMKPILRQNFPHHTRLPRAGEFLVEALALEGQAAVVEAEGVEGLTFRRPVAGFFGRTPG